LGGSARATRGLGTGSRVKLLLDENLSRRLVPALQPRFPGSSQVVLLGLEQASDLEIWECAREQGFVLVSKDEDFADLQTLRGYPPKLVMLRMGNSRNQDVLETLFAAAGRLEELFSQEGIGVAEIG
jgi:predicted nuclease of predicted toxin-antitoxin system